MPYHQHPARPAGLSSALNVGIVPLHNFTLLAFAGFVDTLRLAADEGDRSRPIRCTWTVMTEGGRPVRSSSGITVQSASDLVSPRSFDYVVVVGGTLHEQEQESEMMLRYLTGAATAGIPLIGLCNGVLTLARAGLMINRRACVSWFHHLDYLAEFPDLALVSDRMFVIDRDRITCAGGVGSIHVASWLIERHLGIGAAQKGLRIMLEEAAQEDASFQPLPTLDTFTKTRDPRVRRAVLAMERSLDRTMTLARLAGMVGSTPRHLTRLFVRDLGITPRAALETMRLDKAQRLIRDTHASIADVAADCGFADASHLIRRLRATAGTTPGRLRQLGAEKPLSGG